MQLRTMERTKNELTKPALSEALKKLRESRWEEAAADFRRLLETEADNADLRLNLGVALFEAGGGSYDAGL